MPIRPLPRVLVDQIAAGEVVERPAGAVKELVENAVDAGATQIEVHIADGGRSLISVRDNGLGIAPGELGLAVSPHATSKIATVHDLDAILTMGFRGEALASIGAVSRLTVRSQCKSAQEGGEIRVEGGRMGDVRPWSGAQGTIVEAEDLFHNIPARAAFLKSPRAEAMRVGETLMAMALAHPTVGLRFVVDGKQRFDYPANEDTTQRVAAVTGIPVDALLRLQAEEAAGQLVGCLARPEFARHGTRGVHLILNGRPILDRSLTHAIREGLRGLIEPTTLPPAVLWISVPPDRVDVNVHPTKSEVRLRDGSALFSMIRVAVRRALDEANLVPKMPLPQQLGEVKPAWPARDLSNVSSVPVAGLEKGLPSSPTSGTEPAFDFGPVTRSVRAVERILVLRDSFLVLEEADALVVIDQHALHERMMFERLKDRVGQGDLPRQALLVPEPIQIGAEAVELLPQWQPLLTRLGIEVVELGPGSATVQSFPVLLLERKVSPGPFVEDLLSRAVSKHLPPEPEAALDEVLDMMACKAAIKAGDRLSEAELEDLLAQREAIERSTNCPHGRPTTIRIPVEDLERRFHRR